MTFLYIKIVTGFVLSLRIVLYRGGVKKRASSFSEWPPHLLDAGKARKEGYEERSL